MAQNISVPDIGDFKDVEVIEVLVKPGDKVNKNDPIVTIESDKSSVEIPSPSDGEIQDLKVKIGDKVSEGSILATFKDAQLKAPKDIIKILLNIIIILNNNASFCFSKVANKFVIGE